MTYSIYYSIVYEASSKSVTDNNKNRQLVAKALTDWNVREVCCLCIDICEMWFSDPDGLIILYLCHRALLSDRRYAMLFSY